MRRIIHHLRGQPEQTRRHILHVLTVVLGLVLFALWIYSLGRSATNPDTEAKLKKDLSPLSVFKDNVKEGYQTITGSQSATPLTAE